MKKNIFLFFFFISGFAYSDVINSKSGKVIECSIKHFDTLNLYFYTNNRGETIETYLPLDGVDFFIATNIFLVNNYLEKFKNWELKCKNISEVLSFREKEKSFNKNKTEEYCEIVFYDQSPLFNFDVEKIKLAMYVDFGFGGALQVVKDYKTGKDLVVKSNMAGLNYMNGFGWIFVSTYAIGGTNGGSVYHYIMKRTLK